MSDDNFGDESDEVPQCVPPRASMAVLWSDRPNPPAEQTASARLAGGPVLERPNR